MKTLRTVPAWVLLVVGSALFLMPFYVMVVMSLKTPAEISSSSVWALPQAPTLDNYRLVLTNPNVNFVRFFVNTLLIAVLGTAGAVLSAAVVAFGFARLKFRGRDRLFVLLLSTMMLPGILTLMPSYVMFRNVGWINTILPLTVPAWFGGGAFNIFLLRQFFMGLPRELDEAAVLDGASQWTIFRRIILPLSGPALATVGVFAFIYNWRDFMGPLVFLNETDKQTLEVGLATYNALRATEWHLLMAGSVLVSIPLAIIFLAGQRFFVRGIQLSGGK